MSLDVYLSAVRKVEVYSGNITHNLGKMAIEAGLYSYLWQPESLGIKTAAELIAPLTEGLALLESDPLRFKRYDSPNGWGIYEHFCRFVSEYLAACIENPDAEVSVWR